MATDYNATLEQREITLRIALHGIVYSCDDATKLRMIIEESSSIIINVQFLNPKANASI